MTEKIGEKILYTTNGRALRGRRSKDLDGWLAERRQPDIELNDRGEQVSLMEPTRIGEGYRFRGRITDLALELAQKSAGFQRSLPASLMRSLADHVRSMNCYYSNLIEGHDTHPVDIERALQKDYSGDARKRNLQMEAKAHITVQKWIDSGGLPDGAATSEAGIREIHRRFYELLPAELLWVESRTSGERCRVIPGEVRGRDVQVGRHVAISPGALPRFLERYSAVYGNLGKTEGILAVAAARCALR